jgi:ribosomal protein L11 methyltransferase
MAWLSLEFRVPGADVDALSDALFAVGALSVDVTDADQGSQKERAIYLEPGEDILLSWGHNSVVGLFDRKEYSSQILSALESEVHPLKLPDPVERRIDDQDWVRSTQQQFEPIQITQRLQISPSWSAVKVEPEINIMLDPGLAFGTGSHPTTQLCLQWLEHHVKTGQTVIDYGCGSGILAIAAAKFGADTVVAIDIDEDALESTQYNAKRNKAKVEVISAVDNVNTKADIVVANILPSPLKVLAPLLGQLVKPGGQIVLSGILVDQGSDLMDLYGRWFEMSTYKVMDEWVCLQGNKLGPQ